MVISAPEGSADQPLTITFRLDGSMLPAGESAQTVGVRRNGELVSGNCATAGRAEPDPCVASRTVDGDDVVITVLVARQHVDVRHA